MLQDTVLSLARNKPHSSVRELYEIAKGSEQGLSEEEFVEAAAQLSAGGKVALEEDIAPNVSFIEFLGTWYLSLWVYLVVGVAVVASCAVYLLPNTYPLVVIRWVSGSVFILFLPGYVTMRTLFLKKELDNIENFVLSLGLSLALVPLIGLALTYTRWGVTLNAITLTLTLYVVVVAILAARRSFQLLHMNAEYG
jgi:uncharacterized membrane protein